MGLGPPSRNAFILITVASRCYHAMRMDNAGVVINAVESGCFDEVYRILIELALFFFDELG